MIVAEAGVRFRREAAHWRCAEYPDLLMLPGPERYRVGGQEFTTLDTALRHLRAPTDSPQAAPTA